MCVFCQVILEFHKKGFASNGVTMSSLFMIAVYKIILVAFTQELTQK